MTLRKRTRSTLTRRESSLLRFPWLCPSFLLTLSRSQRAASTRKNAPVDQKALLVHVSSSVLTKWKRAHQLLFAPYDNVHVGAHGVCEAVGVDKLSQGENALALHHVLFLVVERHWNS